MKSFPKLLILILFLSFLLRIVVALYSYNFRPNPDVIRYKDWVVISQKYGFSDTYKIDHLTFGTLPNNQPPGTLYILYPMYELGQFLNNHTGIGKIPHLNILASDFLLRLPSVLTDLGIGALIYLMVKETKHEKFAIFGACLFLFNPVVIYNSAFWGQMDSVNNFFLISALALLLNKRFFLSIIFFAFAIFIKLSLLPLTPLFLILVFLKEKNKKMFFLYLLLVLVTFGVLVLPISANPISWTISFFKNSSSGEMQNITAFAFNFWWVIFKPMVAFGDHSSAFQFSLIELKNSPLSQAIRLGINLNLWGYILYSIFLVPILYIMLKFKNKINPGNIVILFVVLSLAAFLFLPRMHERYMYPVFPLLAAYIGIKGRLLVPYVLLSIFNFINLFVVWHPFIPAPPILNLITNNNLFWFISLATLIVSAYIFLYCLNLFKPIKLIRRFKL